LEKSTGAWDIYKAWMRQKPSVVMSWYNIGLSTIHSTKKLKCQLQSLQYQGKSEGPFQVTMKDLKFVCPCIVNIIPNYNKQDATFLDLFISTDALHVSGGSSAPRQEHITVHTASGIVNRYCCLLLSWMRQNSSHPW